MAGAGLDTASLDDEAFTMEAAQDRCILRLIASCCNGEYLLSMFTSKEGTYHLYPSLFSACLI